jgi:diguanylate cyclase (GGDEF)-like protein
MADAKTLDELLSNPRIPTLPSVALRVLEKVGSPDCTLDAVGEIIRQDPSLCGLILKTLNSALYSFSRPVTSVDKALVIMGLTRIRSLILTLYLPTIRSSCPITPQLSVFWKSSVIGGIIARERSASQSRRDPECDLLAALMRDIGQMVMMQGFKEAYAKMLDGTRDMHHSDIAELEIRHFGVSHADVSAELLKRWRLPPSMYESVRWHDREELPTECDADTEDCTKLLQFASIAADFLTHPATPGLKHRLLDVADALYGMDEDDLGDFLDPLGDKVKGMATFLNVDLGPDENFAEILFNASQELVRLSVEASVESIRREEASQRTEEEAANWKNEAQRLKEQNSRDSLTGLHNRKHLVERLESSVKRAMRIHAGIGLIFIDLDGFKPINDRFGHAAGDTVLKEVGVQLRMNVRENDVVARFGGDEFCVLLTDTSEAGAKLVAERILKALQDMPLTFDGQPCRIGGSLGVAYCAPWAGPVAVEELLEAADLSMYEAKRNGKNRVCTKSFLNEESAKAIDSVRVRSFREFMIRRNQTTADKIAQADNRRAARPCLQRIARKIGWLSREQAVHTTRLQRREGKTFMEAALLSTRFQATHVWTLIAVQQDPPEFLARRLVKSGILSEGEARLELQAYYQWIGATKIELPRPTPIRNGV